VAGASSRVAGTRHRQGRLASGADGLGRSQRRCPGRREGTQVVGPAARPPPLRSLRPPRPSSRVPGRVPGRVSTTPSWFDRLGSPGGPPPSRAAPSPGAANRSRWHGFWLTPARATRLPAGNGFRWTTGAGDGRRRLADSLLLGSMTDADEKRRGRGVTVADPRRPAAHPGGGSPRFPADQPPPMPGRRDVATGTPGQRQTPRQGGKPPIRRLRPQETAGTAGPQKGGHHGRGRRPGNPDADIIAFPSPGRLHGTEPGKRLWPARRARRSKAGEAWARKAAGDAAAVSEAGERATRRGGRRRRTGGPPLVAVGPWGAEGTTGPDCVLIRLHARGRRQEAVGRKRPRDAGCTPCAGLPGPRGITANKRRRRSRPPARVRKIVESLATPWCGQPIHDLDETRPPRRQAAAHG